MIRLVSRYLKHYALYIAAALILIGIQSYVQMVLLIGEMKGILDKGVAGQNMDYVYSSGLKMVLYTVLIGVLTVIISYLTSKVSGIFLCRLRRDCYSKVLSMTPEMFDHFGESTLITRTLDDPKSMTNLIQLMIGRVAMIPMVIVCILALIVARSREIFIILLFATVLAAVILVLLELAAKRRFGAYQKKIDRLNQSVKEKITGVRTIRAFGNEESEENRGISLDNEIKDAALKANQPMKLMSPVTMIIFNWVMVFIYYIGSAEIKSGLGSISNMIVIFQYLSYFTMALSLIPTLVNMLPRAQVASERILNLLDYEANEKDTGNRPDVSVSELSGSVECRNITFGYSKDRPVIKDLSFKIEEGKTLGIIGTTGSGKSTLLQLLMGFYKVDSGDILVDGQSILPLDKETLLANFSYVPQKAFVFQDTVRNNITAYNDSISDDQVREACRNSCFDETLAKLSDGLDTMMSGGGMNLSGGQKKRLSLARALAKNTGIYLLDDPYAALDAVTESKVDANLAECLKGKTKVIVSSRISSIKNADLILVLEKGRAVGLGKHEALLESCNQYKEIYDTQCYLK